MLKTLSNETKKNNICSSFELTEWYIHITRVLSGLLFFVKVILQEMQIVIATATAITAVKTTLTTRKKRTKKKTRFTLQWRWMLQCMHRFFSQSSSFCQFLHFNIFSCLACVVACFLDFEFSVRTLWFFSHLFSTNKTWKFIFMYFS